MRLQHFTATDLEACMAVFETNVPEDFLDEERESFRQFLTTIEVPYLVLRDGARVIACGGWSVEEGEARMIWGMVARDRHRQGLGRLLLLARLRMAMADPSARRATLGTSQKVDGFFSRLGFVVRSRQKDGWGKGMDCVEMTLDLTDGKRRELEAEWHRRFPELPIDEV